MILITICLLIWLAILWRAIRRMRALRDGKARWSAPVNLYGAWQRNPLGTTTFEPDGMEKLEGDLRKAGRQPDRED